MYIVKNALRCIARSKGRNILIGIIALVIAVSACLGLSIRQAAESAKENALDGMSITATISYDRAGAMSKIATKGGQMGGGGGGFNPGNFSDLFNTDNSLTLEQYEYYAGASTVQDFYYTVTAYLDGTDAFQAVSDEEDSGEDTTESAGTGMPSGGFSGFMGGMSFSNGDFTVIGYSSDSAMTEFMSGSVSILSGEVFEMGTEDYSCVISEELSIFNGLSVGDAVLVANPLLETETYTLTVVGVYSNSFGNDFSMSQFGKSQDPANRIYMSANALSKIVSESQTNSTTVTDTTTGNETESKLTQTMSATYVFANVEDYESFEEEVRDLGLDDSYVVSSEDLESFDNSLSPLNTLSNMAKWFLVIILIIGGSILIVLNIFNVRERKYEVGVLTAMGMKKWKVALQFVCEILVVTMVAVIIGAGVGAVSSIPVTNALLESQVTSQSNQTQQINERFGRSADFGNMPGGFGGNMPADVPTDVPTDIPTGGFGEDVKDFFGGASNYISKVDSAMNLTVVLQMILVGLLLTLVASAASVLFIMRYDPLKILANRD